ncbi:expressed unknown protein [Seminavis robusta]|uniref:RING-type domain-containing protein n=1 Tax=Seminavis robusta TaxID=568900 RepID=A0A9N8EIQ6_9STRA|nr:expressed unknown protein [Seminavis robusta]|eukprot:Sro1264_g257390.1 n/a (357) ;mRNA; r:25752-26822
MVEGASSFFSLRRRRLLISSKNNKDRDDDDFVLFASTVAQDRNKTEALVDDPSSSAQQGHLPAVSKKEKLLDISVIVVWCAVVLFTLCYLRSEQQRRRRILRRQRQERLEQFSPAKQATRRLELTHILKATTMIVGTKDLIYHHHGNTPQQAEEEKEGKKDSGDNNGQRGGEDCISDDLVDKKAERLSTTNGKSMIAFNHSEDDADLENGEIEHLFQSHDLSCSSWKSSEDSGDDEVLWTLKLPMMTSSSTGACSSRSPVEGAVPATCIICLKRYRVNDLVSWSPTNNRHASSPISSTKPKMSCPHAFHQQCIVAWLAKLPNCNCPVCRNVFCQPPSNKKQNKTRSSSNNMATMSS